MPVICLRLAYDGTEFAGWQVQPNQRTVQVELELSLIHICERGTTKPAWRWK